MFFIGLAWKNMKKWRFIKSGGLCDHSDMFSWLRAIIFEASKKTKKNMIFLNRNFNLGIFTNIVLYFFDVHGSGIWCVFFFGRCRTNDYWR